MIEHDALQEEAETIRRAAAIASEHRKLVGQYSADASDAKQRLEQQLTTQLQGIEATYNDCVSTIGELDKRFPAIQGDAVAGGLLLGFGMEASTNDLATCAKRLKDSKSQLDQVDPTWSMYGPGYLPAWGLGASVVTDVIIAAIVSAAGGDAGTGFAICFWFTVGWLSIALLANLGSTTEFSHNREYKSATEFGFPAVRSVKRELHAARDKSVKVARSTHERLLGGIDANLKSKCDALTEDARRQLGEETARLSKLVGELGYAGLAWDDTGWEDYAPGVRSPSHVRVGRASTALAGVEIMGPALVGIVREENVLIRASGAAKDQAAGAVQSILLRLLATIPPGMAEFVLLDPAGLGQNVAKFVALADYDRDLIANKAWSEPEHIERQLADLCEHMENVIQGKLQGKYESIEEYNEQAGETAQAYRFLVVVGFPQNFSETSASRLARVALNGPKCGVHTLIVVDTEQKMPYGFNGEDLGRNASVIEWDGSRFVWKQKGFDTWQLTLDAPPDTTRFDEILAAVGSRVKDARRVEVPFDRIAIPSDAWWTGDSRTEIAVPIGKVGARKTQHLVFNSQDQVHALVAGQTGYGKSTLFHVMITNLCLAYSPQELELYLVDFKKGVEFKPYAEHRLPHARVIAIDSEREFGVSVLRGLDTELKRRGDAFRSTVEQNIAGYRKAHPDQACPRIVLIVDEFQEFFTEDDAIAREAGLLLDRLVRQGRNVGIHVILGSQTLTNAGQLAHSTISQIAIRIALHCSDSDSRLILAEDNPGARLLNRPGEAIYNTGSGRVGMEDQFQTVWLSAECREQYLTRIDDLARWQPRRPQRIFEGNAPGEIGTDMLLALTRGAESQQAQQRGARILLGEAIAVQEQPSTVRFRRQGGANLLIVSQQEDTALAMITLSLVGLAVQLPASSGDGDWHRPVMLLDFSSGDGPSAGHYSDLAGTLNGRVRRLVRRQVPEWIDKLANEVKCRIDAEDEAALPARPANTMFLVVHGLQRARDLRQDDGYSLPAYGAEPAGPNTAQQFVTILRDGPDVGVHTIIWCDSMTNLTRTLDRRALREFGTRVVTQISAEDSANLIDSPVASKLGSYRALLYNEDEGTLEKFHPYGLPSKEWLEDVCQQLMMSTASK